MPFTLNWCCGSAPSWERRHTQLTMQFRIPQCHILQALFHMGERTRALEKRRQIESRFPCQLKSEKIFIREIMDGQPALVNHIYIPFSRMIMCHRTVKDQSADFWSLMEAAEKIFNFVYSLSIQQKKKVLEGLECAQFLHGFSLCETVGREP